MSSRLVAAVAGVALFGAVACSKKSPEVVDAGAPEVAATSADAGPATHGSDEHAGPSEHAAGEHGEGDAGHATESAAYNVPFVDEQDPLAATRDFFKESLDDNARYQRDHKPDFFKAFADKQHPRATVITCSDSRVQSPAWDATAENDDFTVRNIGNQLASNLGSAQYGVRELHTPVLLILGHTGCGAVKAAMGDTSKLPEPIQKELSTLAITKVAEGKSPEDAKVWLEGVLANVHDQVTSALKTFPEEIKSGKLTVVGAVFDFRNDMKLGAGKLSIVDVNGVTDPAKMRAFERLVLGLPLEEAKKPGKPEAARPATANNPKADELRRLTEIRDALKSALAADAKSDRPAASATQKAAEKQVSPPPR